MTNQKRYQTNLSGSTLSINPVQNLCAITPFAPLSEAAAFAEVRKKGPGLTHMLPMIEMISTPSLKMLLMPLPLSRNQDRLSALAATTVSRMQLYCSVYICKYRILFSGTSGFTWSTAQVRPGHPAQFTGFRKSAPNIVRCGRDRFQPTQWAVIDPAHGKKKVMDLK